MAVSDKPVDLGREFRSDLVEAYDFIEEYLVGNGICLGASLMLAWLLMFYHLQIWTKPKVQNRIVAMKTGIAMFLSLWLASMKFDTKKSSQQDFVHKFGGRYVENRFPLTLILPHTIIVNQDYPKFLKYCTWQFVPIRLLCSVLMIFLQLHDMYPLWLSWAFFFILNLSVTLAFFTVFAFFLAFMGEFPQRNILARFFYFRLISFVCFLQGGVLKVLVAMGVIKSNHFSDNA